MQESTEPRKNNYSFFIVIKSKLEYFNHESAEQTIWGEKKEYFHPQQGFLTLD